MKKKEMGSAMTRYFSPAVVEEILKSSATLPPDTWEMEVEVYVAQVTGVSGASMLSQLREAMALAQRHRMVADQPSCGLLTFSSDYMYRQSEQPNLAEFQAELTAFCRSVGTVRFVHGRGMATCGLAGETVMIHTFLIPGMDRAFSALMEVPFGEGREFDFSHDP